MCPVKDCNRPITQHERAFIHNNGRLNITVETVQVFIIISQNILKNCFLFYVVQRPVTPAGDPKGIYVSSYCKICKTATPFSPMSQGNFTNEHFKMNLLFILTTLFRNMELLLWKIFRIVLLLCKCN